MSFIWRFHTIIHVHHQEPSLFVLDSTSVCMDSSPTIYRLAITKKNKNKNNLMHHFDYYIKLTIGSPGFSLHKAVKAFTNVLLTFCSR